jgi:NAD(P)-dependent dehydrogenase (short-subunit alcohol dehydrogenase family)
VASERVAVATGGTGAIGSVLGDALRADGLCVAVVDRTGDITADPSSEGSARAAAAAVILESDLLAEFEIANSGRYTDRFVS